MGHARLRTSVAAGQVHRCRQHWETHSQNIRTSTLLRRVGSRRLPGARDNARAPIVMWRASYLLVRGNWYHATRLRGSQAVETILLSGGLCAPPRAWSFGCFLDGMYAACSGDVKNLANECG